MRFRTIAAILLAGASSLAAAPAPVDTLSPAAMSAILTKTATLRLAPDLSHLTPGERAAVDQLLQVGGILQRLYEDARHPAAERERNRLLDAPAAPRVRRSTALPALPGTDRHHARQPAGTLPAGRSRNARQERLPAGNHRRRGRDLPRHAPGRARRDPGRPHRRSPRDRRGAGHRSRHAATRAAGLRPAPVPRRQALGARRASRSEDPLRRAAGRRLGPAAGHGLPRTPACRRRRGGGRRRVRGLLAQPRPRSAVERLRERRRRLGDRTFRPSERPDRLLRDLRRRALRRQGVSFDEPAAARRGGHRRARQVARQSAEDRRRASPIRRTNGCGRRFRSGSTR